MKKWIGFILKTALVIGVIIAILLTIMVNMGGNSKTLRGAIENYIGGATGYKSQVQTLNRMTFFPSITFDIEGLKMHRFIENAGEFDVAPNASITVEKALLVIGFMDVMLASRSLKNLSIENANFAAGTINPQNVTIKTFAIDETPGGDAFIDVKGAIGPHNLRAKLSLQAKGSYKKRKYSIGENSDFTAELGDMKIAGTLSPRSLGGFHINNFILTNNAQEVLSGAFSFIRDGANNTADIRGTFTSAQTQQSAEVNVQIESTSKHYIINGTLETQGDATREDLDAGSRIMSAWRAWHETLAISQKPLRGDVTLNAAPLITDQDTQ